MRPRGWSESAAWLALVLASAACGGVRVAEQALDPELAWPAGDPRVRLERVIEQQRSAGVLGGLLGTQEAGRLFERPYGVAWRGDDLLVADPSAGRVVRIDASGRVTSSPRGKLGAPQALAVCRAGVIASDPAAGIVVLLAPDLRPVRTLVSGLRRPTGVACDDERVYVVETAGHRVLVLGYDGAVRDSIGERGMDPGQFNFPTAVTLDGPMLVVGDTLNFRVQRLDPATGGSRSAFGRLGDVPGEMPRLKGMAIDAAGHLWVSDAHTDTVSLFTASGDLLLSLGGRGTAPGRFSFPAGIAASPDGRVAVVDSFNRRVQVYRLLGRSAD